MAINMGVSLYSLQEDYYLGKRDLEGCIAASVNEIGSKGIEIIIDEMPLPGYRENGSVVSPNVKAWWRDLMAKYGATPTIYGGGLPISMYSNRHQTVAERVFCTKREMKNCADLGFKVFRTCVIPHDDIDVLSECFPYAEDLGITLDVEIHAPRGIHTWWTEDYIEEIERKNTKAGGFVLDFGIFTKGLSLSALHQMMRWGASEQILLAIDAAHKAGRDLSDEDIVKMGGGQVEISAANRLRHATYDDPEYIREVKQYIHAIHGKFYEMTEDCDEPAIDYEGPIRVLLKEGWDGFMDAEYEGQRDYFEMGCDISMDGVEQCRRHRKMVTGIIEKYSK